MSLLNYSVFLLGNLFQGQAYYSYVVSVINIHMQLFTHTACPLKEDIITRSFHFIRMRNTNNRMKCRSEVELK